MIYVVKAQDMLNFAVLENFCYLYWFRKSYTYNVNLKALRSEFFEHLLEPHKIDIITYAILAFDP